MSKSAHAKDAVLEILKKIQGSLADLRNGQVDMRRDIRNLKSGNARILGMIGEMVKAHATVDDRFNALEARVERRNFSISPGKLENSKM